MPCLCVSTAYEYYTTNKVIIMWWHLKALVVITMKCELCPMFYLSFIMDNTMLHKFGFRLLTRRYEWRAFRTMFFLWLHDALSVWTKWCVVKGRIQWYNRISIQVKPI